MESFSIARITKSPAVFDKTKLNWVNGQHLKALPAAESAALIAGYLQRSGALTAAEGPVAAKAVALVAGSCELVSDAVSALEAILSYPLAATVADEKARAARAGGRAGRGSARRGRVCPEP